MLTHAEHSLPCPNCGALVRVSLTMITQELGCDLVCPLCGDSWRHSPAPEHTGHDNPSSG